MVKFITVSISGIFVGILIGLVVLIYAPLFEINKNSPNVLNPLAWHKHQSIGFLPYWLIGNVNQASITNDITTLTYFGLRITSDGSIMHTTSPQESEPGWLALNSGKLDTLIHSAKSSGLTLSLLVASGDSKAINILVKNPIANADTLVSQVTPVMKKYGFTDINLDIEDVQNASSEAQLGFTQFVKEIKKKLSKQNNITLTIEISPADLINSRLISVPQIATTADYIVLMAYDYHYIGSTVTGPVAPLYGGGTFLEYDTNEAMANMRSILPPSKIILGIPSYGYEWDTLDNNPQAAVIPETGAIISNKRAEEFLTSCATCSAQFDTATQEPHIIYAANGSFHQIFYPDKQALQAKISFAETNFLAGIAVWALGYEGKDMLSPLQAYK